MFGIRKRRPPPFGGVHVDDDKDIQVHKPEDASRNDLWSEARLLFRDLIFALMIAALVVVFIVQPVKVEGTSMLPGHLHLVAFTSTTTKTSRYTNPKMRRATISGLKRDASSGLCT